KVPLQLPKNDEEVTGLHMACKFGHLETVKYLATLQTASKDFQVADREGRTALQYAVESARDTKLVEEVLKIASAKKLCTTSGVLVAAMKNPWCAKRLMGLLLGRNAQRYREVDPESKTSQLVVAAITYPFSTLNLVKHVSDGKIDASILCSAA